MRAKLFQLCPTLCDPVDCSPQGSSVRGILQPRILEWVAISPLQGIEPCLLSLLHCRQVPYHLCQLGSLLDYDYRPNIPATCFCKGNFAEIQPHLLVYCLLVLLCCRCRIGYLQQIFWPAKPKKHLSSQWSFIEEFAISWCVV